MKCLKCLKNLEATSISDIGKISQNPNKGFVFQINQLIPVQISI